MALHKIRNLIPGVIAIAAASIAVTILIAPQDRALAQTAGEGGIEPAPPAEAPPPGEAPATIAPAPAAKPTAFRHHVVAEDNEVEPGRARVKLMEDTWVYEKPSKKSKHVARVHADKFIVVTGSTHYYLRVELKNGKVGYISPSTVELVRPSDKVFQLTSDSAVYDQPNRWGKKVAEVHKGHDVHVVGLALDYMKIKMKNGTEGFIPSAALQ